ncbi:hypothetical protein LWM68_45335 [Niabella sp. W65]|nr:hypothetical protein [Niabella sp. W65]MCH7369325.1 hypothetical protein [Niabella sp. W65]ULT44866.1 hypothetical protein KRR40_17035 [Niabella sp. I65]
MSLGVMYTLPMLVNVQAEVYHDGIFRLSLMREDIPVSKRLRAGFMVNSDLEYMADLRYIITKISAFARITIAIWVSEPVFRSIINYNIQTSP